MKYLKLFENFEDIKSICQKYNIENYTINPDGSIDVDGSVNLYFKGLTKLPLKFRNVSGDFSCSDNQLISLEGAPQSVTGDFSCSDNKLISLEGAPQSVGRDFSCYNNQLISLEGAPRSVGGNFYCGDNQLISLEGAPQSVGGYFYCGDNPVYDIWKLFEDKEKIELFNDYDMIHGTDIVLDRLNDFLQEIGKDPVRSVKGYNNI